MLQAHVQVLTARHKGATCKADLGFHLTVHSQFRGATTSPAHYGYISLLPNLSLCSFLKRGNHSLHPSSCSCKAEVRGSAVSLDSQKQGCWGGQGSRHLLICTTIIYLPHHAAPTSWDFLLWSHSCARASQALSYAPLSVCSAFLLVPGIQHTLLDFKTIPRRILQVQLSEAPLLLIIPLLRGPAAQGCW